MNHVESNIKVYCSTNYPAFKSLVENRHINKSKVNSIANDICNGSDLLRYYPILVIERDGRLLIIDGQHRYCAAVETRRPVWYIIAEEYNLLQIAKANSNISSWKNTDYLNLYVKSGNVHYSILDKFLQKTKFPISNSLNLLSTGELGGNYGLAGSARKSFQDGKFEANFENRANDFWELIQNFKLFKGHNGRSFIIAVEVLLKEEKMDFSLLVEKFNSSNPAKFKKAGSPEEYLINFKNVYNS